MGSKTEDEIKRRHEMLLEQEELLKKKLQALIGRQSHLESRVQSIAKVLPNLEIIHSDARQLSDMISFTSGLAENVSGKVRELDTARGRVSECQQRVHDLLDLQLCSDGVQTALDEEDYEKAAGHIHRYLSMDKRLLEKTADDMQQDCSTVSHSISLLQDASTKLGEIICLKFNEAYRREDQGSVERFFKLFPLLRKQELGLEKFSEFLSKKIETVTKKGIDSAYASKGDKRAGVLYADLLTLLFEESASIIEVHQPLIETYYGPGRIQQLVSNLQREIDRQSKIILADFLRTRNLERLAASIKERGRSTTVQKLDPKDLDQLLMEITIMQSRYNLYLRFIRRKIMGDVDAAVKDPEQKTALLKGMDGIIKSSDLCHAMQDLLGKYLLLEHYYMEESVRKAISMDTVETGSHVSSMVDDSFFIVRKCIRRANSTGNLDGVCAVINNAGAVLETEMCVALEKSMRQGYPTGYLDLTQAYNVMIQGRLQQPSDSENAKNIFIAHLNNTEVGTEYVGTLCTGLVNEVPCSNETDKRKLESCLSGLSGVSAAMGAAQELGLHQLSNSAIKPRIAPWVDSFLSLSHCLTQEEFSSYEANDPFIRSLIGNLDNLLMEFKATLTPVNYDNLVAIVATEVNVQMEKVILKTEFNRLGGLALDKEVRALVSYLSKATSWSVRDKFARLTQIATLLNLERVGEVDDYWGTSPLPWRLTPNDVKKVLKLRSDFQPDEISRLKL